ncbi:FkbM family methyltransferase, partial [Cyanobacteria bacterium FACHB-DQ100]|nr:FkbM family methyltransferase [Cyanobacteria bacterium FACHB-DQ100]
MIAKRVSNFIENSSALGVLNSLSLVWNFSLLRKKLCPVLFPGCSQPLYLRQPSSDLVLLKQFLPVFHNWKPKQSQVQVVIDAGANIGLFTIMMANRHPQARIIAIEPDQENFELLVQNCKPYKNVEVIQAALWYKKEPLMISNPAAGHWERQVQTKQDQSAMTIDAVTVSDILKDFGIEKIDVFKIDIEGAEGPLFQHSDLSWLSQVQEMLAELHTLPDMDVQQVFFDALSPYSYSQEELGEYVWLS